MTCIKEKHRTLADQKEKLIMLKKIKKKIPKIIELIDRHQDQNKAHKLINFDE